MAKESQLTYHNGFCEVLVYKAGKVFGREKVPYFFNSINSVVCEVGGGNTTNMTIHITPSLEDALRIMSSGILSATYSDGQTPQEEGQSSSNISPSSIDVASTGAQLLSGGAGGSSPRAKSAMPYYAVRFYYPGFEDATTPWYTGVSNFPDIDFDGSTISITVKLTNAVDVLKSLTGPIVFNGVNALEAIKKLAEMVNVEITFDEDDNETQSILENEKIYGAYNDNKESLIRRILTDLKCTYTKHSGEDSEAKSELRIKSYKYLYEQKVTYSFAVFRQIDPKKNLIPVTSFSLVSKGVMFSPSGSFGHITAAIDPGKKEVVRVISSIDDFDSKTVSGAGSIGGAIPTASGDGSEKGGDNGIIDTGDENLTGAHVPGAISDEAKTHTTVAGQARAAQDGAIEYKITSPGLPKIRPNTLVNVFVGPGLKGIEAFSGVFRVNRFEHKWESGWETELYITKQAGFTEADGTQQVDVEPPKADDGGINAPIPTDIA